MDPRLRLLNRIGDINDFSRPRPLVSIQEFLEHNDDMGSIGYNLPDPPHPSVFYDLLNGLAAREDVADIRIEVKDLELPDGWPATDTIWFITTASPHDVRAWFPENLAPDDLIVGFPNAPRAVEPYELPEGMEAIGAWYD